jgi:3'-5' exonuclease
MTPILVFDIETVPDVAAIRKLWNLPAEATDFAVAELAIQRRRQATGGEFLPLHLQRVVAIACALHSETGLRIWSLANAHDSEDQLIQRFFDGIERFSPQLVSWNGSGFDLPVLHYRAMIHGLAAPRYWEMGDGDGLDARDFKWNNYISRYHMRHLDLMDLLALYNGRANAPLDDLAKLCGFPGKLGTDGSQVWSLYQAGEIGHIRAYCETDVANTYLLYLRFQHFRGHLLAVEYQERVAQVREFVNAQADRAPHWAEYRDAWLQAGREEPSGCP